jgi:hypothetical protein
MILNYRNLSLHFLLAAFLVLLAVMLVATLYPFDFLPVNGVEWLSDEPGLYFNGHGISYTDKAKTICETKAVSVMLWLKERFGSKNWGPKEIFFMMDLPLHHWLLVNGVAVFFCAVASRRMKAMSGTDYFVPHIVFLVGNPTLLRSLLEEAQKQFI